MSIEALCGRCAARLVVDDSLAGTRLRCDRCGGTIVVAGTPSQPAETHHTQWPGDDAFRAMEEAAHAESAGTAVESDGLATAAAASQVQPMRPVQRPVRRAATAAWAPRIELPDELARWIAQLLIFVTVGTAVWIAYRKLTREIGVFPDAFKFQVWTAAVVVSIWELLVYFLGIAPAATAVCKLAARLTRDKLPYDAYVRTTGALALPCLFSEVVAHTYGETARILFIIFTASPLLALVALKFLLNVAWRTSALSMVLVAVVVIALGVVARLLTVPVTHVVQTVTGLTPDALLTYFEQHPEERDKFIERRRELAIARLEEAAGRSSDPSSPAAKEAADLATRMRGNQITEALEQLNKSSKQGPLTAAQQTEFERLVSEYDTIAPKLADTTRAYADLLIRELGGSSIARLPAGVPAEVYQPIEEPLTLPTNAGLPQPLPSPGPDTFYFGPLIVRPPAGARFVPQTVEWSRSREQKWLLKSAEGYTAVEVRSKRAANGRQNRPWVLDMRANKTGLQEKLAIGIVEKFATDATPVTTAGKLNGIGWFRLEVGANSAQPPVTYMARVDSTWLTVISRDRGRAADQFVHYLSLVGSPGTELEFAL